MSVTMIVAICPIHGPTASDIDPRGRHFCLVADLYNDICGETCEVHEAVFPRLRCDDLANASQTDPETASPQAD